VVVVVVVVVVAVEATHFNFLPTFLQTKFLPATVTTWPATLQTAPSLLTAVAGDATKPAKPTAKNRLNSRLCTKRRIPLLEATSGIEFTLPVPVGQHPCRQETTVESSSISPPVAPRIFGDCSRLSRQTVVLIPIPPTLVTRPLTTLWSLSPKVFAYVPGMTQCPRHVRARKENSWSWGVCPQPLIFCGKGQFWDSLRLPFTPRPHARRSSCGFRWSSWSRFVRWPFVSTCTCPALRSTESTESHQVSAGRGERAAHHQTAVAVDHHAEHSRV